MLDGLRQDNWGSLVLGNMSLTLAGWPGHAFMAIAEKEEGKPKGQRLFEMSGLAFSFLLSKRDDERVLKPESRNEAGHHPTNQGDSTAW